MREATDDELERLFTQAARFLKDKCEHEGWRWSSNFLREYVRCSSVYAFSNTRSPTILRLVRERHPELRRWVELGTLKGESEGSLFE